MAVELLYNKMLLDLSECLPLFLQEWHFASFTVKCLVSKETMVCTSGSSSPNACVCVSRSRCLSSLSKIYVVVEVVCTQIRTK